MLASTTVSNQASCSPVDSFGDLSSTLEVIHSLNILTFAVELVTCLSVLGHIRIENQMESSYGSVHKC